MKTNLFKLVIVLAALTCKLYGQKPETTTMLVEGYYTGKNLIVRNCYHLLNHSTQAFSIHQVKTNGSISPAAITNDIFEIPLEPLHLKIGDSVKVEIKYIIASSPKTKPSILNPGALLPFENKITSIENHLTVEGEFNWGTLIMINPYNTTNKTYCMKEIKINGKTFDVDLNKEIVSVDLSKLGQPTVFNSEEEEKTAKAKGGLKEGDRIQIDIVYTKGSDPTILNPELITPWSSKQ